MIHDTICWSGIIIRISVNSKGAEMKRIIFVSILILAAGISQNFSINKNEQVRLAPRMLNYQGYLADTLGNPITNPSVSMTFAIYDAVSAGNQKWTETQGSVNVNKGIFSVLLGGVTPIPDSVFTTSTNRWFELTIAGQILTPRTGIVAAPYAYTATYADTAFYVHNGAGDNNWIFLISDGADTTLQTGGPWGLARAGNVLFGNADSTHVNFGIACTTGYVDWNDKYCTIGGGYLNSIKGSAGTIAGGEQNSATDWYATVGGGYTNIAGSRSATVAGGESNTASSGSTTVGGGYGNTAISDYATVGGGTENNASGQAATVSGGYGNVAYGSYAIVGGGAQNEAGGSAATISGGSNNTTGNAYATVSGGFYNTAFNLGATIAGGRQNTINGDDCAIGGGCQNMASNYYSYIGGGLNNYANGIGAVIAGGETDSILGDYSFAAGKGVKINNPAYFSFGFGSAVTIDSPAVAVFYHPGRVFKMGIGQTNPLYPLHMGGGAYCTGTQWMPACSRKYKENIQSLSTEAAQIALDNLDPVTFNYKNDKDEECLGFIAEDVPDLVAVKGRNSVSPMDLIAVLTKVVQEQEKKIEKIETDNAELRRFVLKALGQGQ